MELPSYVVIAYLAANQEEWEQKTTRVLLLKSETLSKEDTDILGCAFSAQACYRLHARGKMSQ